MPGIKPGSPALQADPLLSESRGKICFLDSCLFLVFSHGGRDEESS